MSWWRPQWQQLRWNIFCPVSLLSPGVNWQREMIVKIGVLRLSDSAHYGDQWPVINIMRSEVKLINSLIIENCSTNRNNLTEDKWLYYTLHYSLLFEVLHRLSRFLERFIPTCQIWKFSDSQYNFRARLRGSWLTTSTCS